MFGKSVAEYLRFERVVLAAILMVGLVRFGLSLAGVPIEIVKMFSMTVMVLFGALYCGVAVARSGFGTYRHLLPLLFFQGVVLHGITILAIALAGLTGQTNAFTAPEYSNLPNYLPHALGHVAGMVVGPLVMWPLAALAMWVARAVGGGAPAGARA